MRMKCLMIAAAACLAAGAAEAQYSNGNIKIGVMNDQSGTYADLAGPGSVWAAKKAVEDFCKAQKCHDKIEVIFADHQNKPDVGAGIARADLHHDRRRRSGSAGHAPPRRAARVRFTRPA